MDSNDDVQVFLTRRNLETLIDKLDGVKRGISSHCTLIKRDNKHPNLDYRQSHENIIVTAVEDSDYYIHRLPGKVAQL